MVPQTLLALVLAGRALLPSDSAFMSYEREQSGDEAPVLQARYRADTREVTNWRFEAIDALEPKSVIVLSALLKAERPFVTRCVKLNNYWCIKSARWNGELATDSEGHVGFASAEHGADAAAMLLRRYYMQYNRKSALDIVRRWAPAECNVATGIGGMAVLAVKGIGGTVRARYLASRKRGKVVRYTAQAKPGAKPGRVSMTLSPAPKTPQFRVPDIAAGMGERKKPAGSPKPLVVTRAKPVPQPKVAPQPTTAASIPLKAGKPATVTACAPDEQRLRNYAARMVAELDVGATDDLKLFAEDGMPLPNLASVMLAMSSFELGALRASPDLVEGAVQRMVDQIATKRAAAEGGQDPIRSIP